MAVAVRSRTTQLPVLGWAESAPSLLPAGTKSFIEQQLHYVSSFFVFPFIWTTIFNLFYSYNVFGPLSAAVELLYVAAAAGCPLYCSCSAANCHCCCSAVAITAAAVAITTAAVAAAHCHCCSGLHSCSFCCGLH